MKILYLKGYKWLFSQNQLVKNDFFGDGRYKALAKHIKPFLKKHERERTSVPGLLVINCIYFFKTISFYLLIMLENQLSYCFAQDCACEPPCLTVNQKEFFLVNEIKGNCYNLDVTVLHYDD